MTITLGKWHDAAQARGHFEKWAIIRKSVINKSESEIV